MTTVPKTISAFAMRDQLLARLQTPQVADDWVRVLGIAGHRHLLGLIARHSPPSIGALSELAGRAQPNVSRAITALASAGLIRIAPDGRRSIPQITEAGAAKARELGLLEHAEEVPAHDVSAVDLFSIDITDTSDANAPTDEIEGTLTSWLWLNSSKERVAARADGDLDSLARRLLTNWWRLLYRRDAPFRLWEFKLEGGSDDLYGLAAIVQGAKVNLQARTADGRFLHLEQGSQVIQVATFEQHLLDEVLRPLAARHWLNGRSARPLHALLRRIEDSRDYPIDRTFCRTAGSLGLSPYDLSNERAGNIRDLLDFIVDEDARLDFGSAVLADALAEGQLWTSRQLDLFRQRNAMPILTRLRESCVNNHEATVRPFRHGYALARSARAYLHLAEDQPVGGVSGLSKLLGAQNSIGLSPEAPGALRAFQSLDGDAPTFIVEQEGARSSAFTLARSVGDFIAFGSQASCVADLYTDRQAVGRAFAAEFMAPRLAVVHLVEEEDQPISRIADHFGVSVSVVHRQYENAHN